MRIRIGLPTGVGPRAGNERVAQRWRGRQPLSGFIEHEKPLQTNGIARSRSSESHCRSNGISKPSAHPIGRVGLQNKRQRFSRCLRLGGTGGVRSRVSFRCPCCAASVGFSERSTSDDSSNTETRQGRCPRGLLPTSHVSCCRNEGTSEISASGRYEG
jgi:hypothetical protein